MLRVIQLLNISWTFRSDPPPPHLYPLLNVHLKVCCPKSHCIPEWILTCTCVKTSTVSTQFTAQCSNLFNSCKICITAFSSRIAGTWPPCFESMYWKKIPVVFTNVFTISANYGNHNFWYKNIVKIYWWLWIEFKRSQCKMYNWSCFLLNNVTSTVPHVT